MNNGEPLDILRTETHFGKNMAAPQIGSPTIKKIVFADETGENLSTDNFVENLYYSNTNTVVDTPAGCCTIS